MSATGLRVSRDDLARRGDETFAQRVRPLLRPEDEGKFVAVDVESGAFEVDEDDHAAVARLHRRMPGAQVWLVRVGSPAAHLLRRGRCPRTGGARSGWTGRGRRATMAA